MNLSRIEENQSIALVPEFRFRDCIPFTFLLCALCFSFGVLTVAFLGIPWSISREEWAGLLVSVLFASGAAWLLKKGFLAALNSVPRKIIFSQVTDSFEIHRLWFRRVIPRGTVSKLSMRVEVSEGGMKTSPGIWVYLCLRIKADIQSSIGAFLNQ